MADIHETAHKEPTEPAGDVLVRGIARLLARQAARDLVSETVPGSSPKHVANNKEHRHDEQDR